MGTTLGSMGANGLSLSPMSSNVSSLGCSLAGVEVYTLSATSDQGFFRVVEAALVTRATTVAIFWDTAARVPTEKARR